MSEEVAVLGSHPVFVCVAMSAHRRSQNLHLISSLHFKKQDTDFSHCFSRANYYILSGGRALLTGVLFVCLFGFYYASYYSVLYYTAVTAQFSIELLHGSTQPHTHTFTDLPTFNHRAKSHGGFYTRCCATEIHLLLPYLTHQLGFSLLRKMEGLQTVNHGLNQITVKYQYPLLLVWLRYSQS